jgi:hypothetical protein
MAAKGKFADSLIRGRRIKKDWIYRKAAEAAKGRRENSQKIWGRQDEWPPASETIALCYSTSLRFLCDLCGSAVKNMCQPFSPA